MATLTALLDQQAARVRQANWPEGHYLELSYEPTRRAVLHWGQGQARAINLAQLIQESAHLDYHEVFFPAGSDV